MRGRGVVIGSIVASALWAGSARGADHLVAPESARAELARAARERATDVATIERALSTPAADRAGARLGVSMDRVRAAVPTLTDAEIQDLASRAAAVDPAAGSVDPWVNDVLVVILIVAIVAVVLSAV